MDLNKLFELQERIRKNTTSKSEAQKFVEDVRKKNHAPDEPIGTLGRVSAGLMKVVFYRDSKSPYVIARLYNVLESAQPFDLTPEASRALQTVFEAGANCTPKQFKDLLEKNSNIKKQMNNFTVQIVLDAFYEKIISQPRQQQFYKGSAELKETTLHNIMRKATDKSHSL